MNAVIDYSVQTWGWSLLRWEKMTLTKGYTSNSYYGVKVLGLKILVWHHLFDSKA